MLYRNLNYWDSVSTLAGEVASPGKTFPRALLMAVGLVIFMYVAPLAACLGVMPEAADWKLGFFATVAQRVGGSWLAWWMLAAAAVRISGVNQIAAGPLAFVTAPIWPLELLSPYPIGTLIQCYCTAQRAHLFATVRDLNVVGSSVILQTRSTPL